MTVSVISKAEPQSKPPSLAEQIGVLKLLWRRELSLIFPEASPVLIERIRLVIDAAAQTLSELTDW